MAAQTQLARFPVFLIKPSHYDDDGYVIRWMRSVIPSNTLATMYGLMKIPQTRFQLGESTWGNVEILAKDLFKNLTILNDPSQFILMDDLICAPDGALTPHLHLPLKGGGI